MSVTFTKPDAPLAHITGDAKATPVGSDQILIADSEASGAAKLITISSLPTGGSASDLDDVPDSASRLAMQPAERTKLSAVEPLATAAGAVGDAHAVATGNPHGTTQNDIVGLTAALAGKASTVHTHAQADVTGLQTSLDNKAPVVHAHVIADTTGLQVALDGKAPNAHTHAALQAQIDAANPYMLTMTANGVLTGPLVKTTGAMTAITLLDKDTFRIQVIYNAGANVITVASFAGTTLVGSNSIAVGAVAKFCTLLGGTQVQRLP